MVNILIIAYHFPPEMSGGVNRPYSFYKYFYEYGLQPIIITHDAFGYSDNESNVIRCNSLRDWRNAKIFNKKIFLKIICKMLNSTGLLVQNDFVWQHNVKKIISNIILKNRIKGIYATFPPIDTLMLGIFISRKYHLPLLSEFRDGLVFESLQKYHVIQKARVLKIERIVLEHSKAIVTIGKKLSQYFIHNYHNKNIFTVYNGYDKIDFEGLQKNKLPRLNKVKIAHFGAFNRSRKTDITPLLMALDRLKADAAINRRSFELSLIGTYTKDEHKMVAKIGLNDIIYFYPQMKKQDGFRRISSDYNFLLFYGVKDQKTIISSKLLEYLMLNKPILGICKGNEAEEIITKTGTGEVCDFIVDSIYDLFKKFIEGKYKYNPRKEEITKFDQKILVGQTADIIKHNLLD